MALGHVDRFTVWFHPTYNSVPDSGWSLWLLLVSSLRWNNRREKRRLVCLCTRSCDHFHCSLIYRAHKVRERYSNSICIALGVKKEARKRRWKRFREIAGKQKKVAKFETAWKSDPLSSVSNLFVSFCPQFHRSRWNFLAISS